MSRKPQIRGQCAFCGREMTRGGLARHLSSCAERQAAIQTANQGSGQTQQLYHLQVQDAWGGDFWLHLEMNGSATLADLDSYLRAIWLECCGHLSRFSFGGWSGDEIAFKTQAARLFEPGMVLTHIYDFGTSSETLIKVVEMREGKPLTRHPIYSMARNNMPVVQCMACDQPAQWLCLECLYELDETGYLCDEHVGDHPHEDYGEPMQIVNSPRVGMCGYRGPADPPY
ncbi:MAG: plasmid pRiA4b ORF-3 family protein [Chloroflexi bacterium]|nr:plasmid pRiA4b ORF-3 family protein [Chloroflexota bacterium]MBU1749185.1 plasmid pRiA4b ORF-3 family protein [Chloroflexota bacterium]